MEIEEAIAVRDEFLSVARQLTRGRMVRSMITDEDSVDDGGVITASPEFSRSFSVSLGTSLNDDDNDYGVAVRTTAADPRVEEELLPLIAERTGGNVDLVVLDRIVARSTGVKRRQRPLRIGASIGHPAITAGTLGAFARDRAGGRIGMISNNHVLADSNRARIGDPIYQPGPIDGGGKRDRVGALERFITLDASNEVDAAFALLDDPVEKPDDIAGRVALNGRLLRPRRRLEVIKYGRTTGFTTGMITAFDLLDVEMNFDGTIYSFDGQIEIASDIRAPFSAGGDSGALVATQQGEAVGLLFGGGPTADGLRDITFVNPIDRVLDLLDVDLVT